VPESQRTFIDSLGALRLVIEAKAITQMLRHATKCPGRETGGILIGRYSNDNAVAVVEEASPAPSDSIHAKTTFVRGTRGLRGLLSTAWDRGSYYLGEWHTHPEADPAPSMTDDVTLGGIGTCAAMHCTNPILLVLGNDARIQASSLLSGRLISN
jgi:integrative and conjugative element protein (TIGR02256 family)